MTDALRKYVDERASDKDVYATPSEYIRDLIRQDMRDRANSSRRRSKELDGEQVAS
ncbi:MAG: hypothetical protein ACLQO1_07225 [Steroidobacteraceae bacterium]